MKLVRLVENGLALIEANSIKRAVEYFYAKLLTYVIKTIMIINDICQEGDAHAQASQMPQN